VIDPSTRQAGDDSTRVNDIEAALRQTLPQQSLNDRRSLAQLLSDLEQKRITAAEAERLLSSNPELKRMFKRLEGQTLSNGNAPISISFGEGNQFGDITFGDIVAGDQLNVSINLGDPRAIREQEKQDRFRLSLIKLVRDIWITDMLDNRLAEVLWISLGLTEQPEAVPRSIGEYVPEARGTPRPITPGTKTIEIFDRFGCSLLILGEPGAGKTTLLLELARDLLNRAEDHVIEPVPVVFNLSNWALRTQPLEDWLILQLQKMYHVPPHESRPLIEQNALVLLLDGLDEVAPEARLACAQAINRFKEKYRAPIAVCSRVKDYQALTTHLMLQGAVLAQPITSEQIVAYLGKYDGKLDNLRDALLSDDELCKLAETPLMLSMMAVVFKEGGQQAIAEVQTREEKQRAVFDQYIEKMFVRRGEHKQYTKERTIGWLTWLAEQLQQQKLTVFLIEQLQPSWLAGKRWVWLYTLISRMISVFLLTSILGVGVFAANIWELLLLGLLGGGVVGVIDGVRLTLFARSPSENIAYTALRILGVWLLVALALGPFFGLAKQGPEQDLIFNGTFAVTGFNLGVFAAGFVGVMFGLRGSRQRINDDVHTAEQLKWSFGDALRGAANYGIGFNCLGWAVGTAVWLSGGRGGAWATRVGTDLFGWVTAPFGVSNDLINILILATVVAGGFGVAFGTVMQGLKYTIIDVKDKRRGNQGISLSLRNAVRAIGTFSIAFSFFFFGLLLIVNDFDLRYLTEIIAVSIRTGVVIGFAAALWNGGFDIVQHYVLRALLYAQGFVPPGNYVRFLDFATDRIFLNRPGGGYIFLHRTLQEHFAAHKAEHVKTLPNQWRPLLLRLGLFLGAVAVVLAIFTFGYGPAVLLTHERLGSEVPFHTVQIGENIERPEGIYCEDICVEAGDTVLVQAGGLMHTGHFVIWVNPNGTNAGFIGAPMGTTWDIPNIPVGTLHGALMCRISGEQDWRQCGPRLEFQAPIAGCLEFMINGIEFQKYAGYYYVSAQIQPAQQ
jgi:DNA polymerase III delta prime subunit